MLPYVLRRLVTMVPVLLVVSVVVFSLIHLTPGDPVSIMLREEADAETAATLRAALGLDRPLPVQYAVWLGRAVRGELGRSIRTNQPVGETILQRLPVTLCLAGAATLLALSGVSMPNFWLAILMIFLFSVTLGWLPPLGWVSPARDFWGGVRSIVLRHIVPATLAAIIVHASLRVAFAVLAEAGLSFLGLGTQPPTPSWGAMLSSGREYLEMAPWLAIAPGAAIFVTTLGFNFLGDGLRDAADPRLRA